MTIDLRRFAYALEPLRHRRRMELDALRVELGRVQQDLTAAEEQVGRLREELRHATASAARDLLAHVDPSVHPRSLGWLVQLRAGIEAGSERVRTVREERDEVRARLLVQQQKMEVVERHREDALAEFAKAEEARLATEADREWLARRDWAGSQVPARGDE